MEVTEEFVERDEFEGLEELADTDAVYSVSRMAEILQDGDPIDQEFVLSEVQQLLGHCSADFQEILLPVLCERVVTWVEDLQFKGAQALSFVVTRPITRESGQIIIAACVEILQAGTNLTGDDRVFFFQVWSGILVEAMQSPEIVLSESDLGVLLQLASRQAKEELMESRKAAARIYGALATTFDEKRIIAHILPDMVKLFTDDDVTVLGTSIEAMVKIVSALPPERVQKSIWPRLITLTQSEDVRIRCTALRSIAQILANLREKASPEHPIFAPFLESAAGLLQKEAKAIKQDAQEDLRLVSDEKYMLLEVQSDVFGEYVFDVCDIVEQSTVKDLFKAFALMASCNGPLLRRNVAFNFPGFTKAMCDKYGDLTAVLELLSRDKDDEVRWNLSAGLHESVLILLPSGKVDRLAKVILALLTDQNPSVTLNVMEHFKEIIEVFHRVGAADQVRKLVNGLSDLKGMVDGSWRLQELIAKQLKSCICCFDETTITDVILPLTWTLVHDGMPPVRVAAAQAIVHSLRRIADKNLFDASVKKYFFRIAALDNAYRIRLAQVEAALECLTVFSSLFFKEFFAKGLLKIVEDPVSNVRLKLAISAHKFAPICGDMFEFRAALAKLRNDEDQDVKNAMKSFKVKAQEEGRIFTTQEHLLEDQNKLKEERKFYSKRSDINEMLRAERSRKDNMEGGRSDTNRLVKRGIEIRQSMKFLTRTKSFSDEVPCEVVEENDMRSLSGGLRRSRSLSRMVRRSSSAEPPDVRNGSQSEDARPGSLGPRSNSEIRLSTAESTEENCVVSAPPKRRGLFGIFSRGRD